MRIAMFGGSFNPVHIGHLQLADEVARHFALDKVYFVPAARPPHKNLDSGASDDDRVSMLELSVAGNDCFAVLDWELKRPGISYTVDTLRKMKAELCGDSGERPGLILGADLAPDFVSWREPGVIAEIAEIILCKRDGQTAADFPWPHTSIDNISFRVSSSSIRERIRTHKSFRYFLNPEVYDYVQSHRLYL